MKKLIFLLPVTLLLLVSCKKYPEGPGFSLKSKTERFSNHWKPTKVTLNNVDDTPNWEGITIEIRDDGSFTVFYFNGTTTDVVYAGTWAFDDKKEAGVFSYTFASMNFTDTWIIIRLKEEELWVEEDDGPDHYEYEFAPN